MAFADFLFPKVLSDFGLTLTQADLFGNVPPMLLDDEIGRRLQLSASVGAMMNTEKARSEFIIAPILFELRWRLGGGYTMFSGTSFDVDSARGLVGVCDFIISRSPVQLAITAPIIAIVEAKNDNLATGLAQCIAATVAAREFNRRPPKPTEGAVYGLVTTGVSWQFFRLLGDDLTADAIQYTIADVPKVLGILAHIIQHG